MSEFDDYSDEQLAAELERRRGGGQTATERARELYGSAAAGGGNVTGGMTGSPGSLPSTGDPKTDADNAFLAAYAERFNAGLPISPSMADRFERVREGRAWLESMAERGRFGVTPDQLPWLPEARRARGGL